MKLILLGMTMLLNVFYFQNNKIELSAFTLKC